MTTTERGPTAAVTSPEKPAPVANEPLYCFERETDMNTENILSPTTPHADPALPKLLYTKEEAAQILNIPATSIEWQLRKDILPRRRVAGRIRFTLEDLQLFVDRSKAQ